VGDVTEFKLLGRNIKCVNVPQKNGKQDRPIILIKVNKDFYALDARCYHAGGPLEMGDRGWALSGGDGVWVWGVCLVLGSFFLRGRCVSDVRQAKKKKN